MQLEMLFSNNAKFDILLMRFRIASCVMRLAQNDEYVEIWL